MKRKHRYLLSLLVLGVIINLTSCGPSSQMFAVEDSNNNDGIYSTLHKEARYDYSESNYIENIAGDPTLGLDYENDSSYTAYMRSKYLNDETSSAYYNVDTSNVYYAESNSPKKEYSETNNYISNYYGSAGFSPYGMSFGMGMSFGFGGYPGYGYPGWGYPGYGYPGYGYPGWGPGWDYPGYGYPGWGYPGYGYSGYGYPGYGYPIHPGGERPSITMEKRRPQGGNYKRSGYNNNIKYDYKRKSNVASSYKKNNSNGSSSYSKYRNGATRSSSTRSNRTSSKKSNNYYNNSSNSNYNRSSTPTRNYSPSYNSSSRSSGVSRSSSGARRR